MKEIIISAPGKVILHGEHAVVYGKRALAASLDLRTFLRLTAVEDGKVKLTLPDIQLERLWSTEDLTKAFTLPLCDASNASPPSEDLLKELKAFAGLDEATSETKSLAVVAFLYLYGSICSVDGVALSVQVHLASNLPTSAGLGSSAAFSACLAASFLSYRQLIEPAKPGTHQAVGKWTGADLELIDKWAFQAEKIIHGNPSGIDNSVSCYGGALNFQSGKITPLDKVPKLRILLLNTKVPRSTKKMVAQLREKYNKYQEIIGPVLDSIEAISQKCISVLEEMNDNTTAEHYSILKDLIAMNQHHLSALGVSHASLDQVCLVCSSQGLQAKLTGAGGGGCAFALITPDSPSSAVATISQEVSALGYDCWETAVGSDGVVQHLNNTAAFKLPASFSSL